MAEKLSRMYGTEEDKVNCPFYFKIGACRYENKCLRIHNRPSESQTILIKHMYQNSPTELALAQGNRVAEDEAQKALNHYEEFYEEVFLELASYGEIDDLIICDNIGDHMKGNVYVKYVREAEALKCLMSLKTRYYDKQQLQPEFSPVTDFSNAKCKQYIEGQCKRSGYCNYIHSKPIGRPFRRSLFRQMYEEHPEYKNRSRSRSRSDDDERSKKKRKDKERSEKHEKDSKKKHSRSRSSHKKHKKDKDKKKRKSRSHSKHSKSASPGYKNSEERRAEIAKWGEDDDEEDMKVNASGSANNNGTTSNNEQSDSNNKQGTHDYLAQLVKPQN
ncbi:hypothetical protein ABPG74_003016 [Tetrahymena malaccensis]